MTKHEHFILIKFLGSKIESLNHKIKTLKAANIDCEKEQTRLLFLAELQSQHHANWEILLIQKNKVNV